MLCSVIVIKRAFCCPWRLIEGTWDLWLVLLCLFVNQEFFEETFRIPRSTDLKTDLRHKCQPQWGS